MSMSKHYDTEWNGMIVEHLSLAQWPRLAACNRHTTVGPLSPHLKTETDTFYETLWVFSLRRWTVSKILVTSNTIKCGRILRELEIVRHKNH